MAVDNKSLGQFDLVGIPPAPRGVPQIEVSFDIDADGILNVSAKDTATGKEQRIVIKSSGGLSESEIENMVKDAEMNQAADQARKEAVEVKNELDSLTHSVAKNLEEHGEKVDQETKDEVNKAIDAAKALPEDAGLETMKTTVSQLQEASMKIGKAMYGKKEGEAASEEDGNTASEEKKTAEDVEYEEKKTDEKK